MDSAPEVGSVWRHSKTRREYVVVGMARRESDCELVVLYRLMIPAPVKPELPWARPLSEWHETVGVDGKAVPRFVLVSNAPGRCE